MRAKANPTRPMRHARRWPSRSEPTHSCKWAVIDEKAEAIDEVEEGEPVLEDGVLVLLGAVPTGRSPSVDAERYVDLDNDEHFRISLERSNDEWSIVDLDAVGT